MSPQVSVFTPSHDPQWLGDCYASLQRQTEPDWEWIVLLNGGARWLPPTPDPRVRVSASDAQGVGAVKRQACALARADVLLELDHDDLLDSRAVEAVIGAFAVRPDAGLVYSHSALITPEGQRDESYMVPEHGWTYRPATVDGLDVWQVDTLVPSPHNISYIWYAPNHLRAFRRSTYDAVGGYDAARDVLDDQDLMCRLWQAGPVVCIDECLYLQRAHPASTQRDPDLNARIQRETVELYDRYVEGNALAWAAREGLHALDLGAAHNKPAGYLGVDQYPGVGVDIVGDVTGGIPLPDASVGVIRAYDFLEHVPDKIAMFNELYRLLAHGGILLSATPSTDGRGAFQDPTHVAFYNENSFWYFTDATYARYVPSIRCRFQVSRLVTSFPSAWHEQHQISYVTANLIAIKDGPRQGGLLHI